MKPLCTENQPTLYFFCGKMAAGKSTIAAELARTVDAVLLVEDEFLVNLFPGEILDIPDYARCSRRVKAALEGLICTLLSRGTSVVLDFPGNTITQRQWFRQLIDRANVRHELHFINASDDCCKRQLRERSKSLSEGSAFTTEQEFAVITAYFQAPSVEEDFHLIVHRRA